MFSGPDLIRIVRTAGFFLVLALCFSVARLGFAQQSGAAVNLGTRSLQWEGEPARRFFASTGRNGFLSTVGPEGVEGYLYPLEVFHDLRVSFQLEGSDKRVEGRAIAQSVSVTPSEVVRLYAADGLRIHEALFAPVDHPALLLLYELESEQPVTIHVSFRPDLDLMWPAGIGGQSYSWDDALKAFKIEEPSDTFHARIGSPAAVLHSDPMDRTQPWNSERSLSIAIHAEPHQVVPVIATIGLPGKYNASALYTDVQQHYASWQHQAREHYEKLIASRLQITTGDAETDAALAWSTIALDQAEGCNPDFGCAQLGGYGPTWPTRRPQYAWFFAGDGLITAWALEAEGAHDQVTRELALVRKYQNAENGAIWHEIAQSAAYVDWFHRYPYIYRHTDISPLYLLAMRNIWRATGDRTLLETSWPSLEAAWNFCVAHVDVTDGLITIPPDQSGVNENETDRTEKELPLEIVWAGGAQAFSELANAMGKPSLAEKANRAAQKARASLKEFWDPVRHFYFEGLLSGGRPFRQEMASAAWGIWEDVLPPEKRDAVLDRLAQPAFSTAWGLRSMPSDDPKYQPDSYAHGSVWPLTTATYVLAALAAHRPEQAWPMWQALVKESFLNSPGHIPEVLSGVSYRMLDVSVPEQTWSSAALMTATVRGVLGLDPDAPNNKLRFEPHLPVQWRQVSIANFAFGQRKLAMSLRRTTTEVELTLTNNGPQFDLEFAPMVPAGAQVKAFVDSRSVAAILHQEQGDTHATVQTTVGKSAGVRLLIQTQ